MAKALFLEDLPIIGKYIRDLLANKVDKVEGKNLSTNDYTTEEKTKLEALSNDYDDLTNKPSINGVTLSGNKTTEDLIPIGDGLNFNADGELEATGGSDVLVIEAVIYNETPELYSIRFEKSLTEIVSDIKGVNGNAIVKIWTTSRKLKCYLSETFNGDGSGNWVTNVRRYSDNYSTVCRDVLMIGNSSDNRESVWKYPLQKNLTFDFTPTQNSSNPVTSGGIYNALQNAGTSDYPDLTNKPSINDVTLEGNKTSAELGLMPEQEVDTTPTESSENLITSGAVWSADKNIKDKLQGSKTASTSGGTIEIPDYGMTESIQMYFKPTQDLHGYDKPWAGGAGKNKLPNEITTATEGGITFSTQGNGKVKISGTSTKDIYETDICENYSLPLGNYILSYDGVVGVTVQICNRAENVEYCKVDFSTPSATLTVDEVKQNDMRVRFVIDSGVTVDSETGIMIRLSTESDADFAPYSNICPISGQDNATFEWTGKNLFDKSTMTDNMWLDGSDAHLSPNANTYTTDYIKIYNGKSVFIPGTGTSRRFVFDINKENPIFLNNAYDQIYTPTADGYLRVSCVKDTISANDLQIEYGDHATSYKHYIHEELSLNFGKTCYGGFCTFDGNVYPTWSYTASYNGETLSGKWVSDRDEYRIGRTPTIGAEVAYENPQSTDYFRVTPPANLSLTDDYPIEYNGWMASINYQPKGTVLVEAKKYTNQEIAKLGLPQPPTTNGTYHLECSVNSVIPTIRWVLNTTD